MTFDLFIVLFLIMAALVGYSHGFMRSLGQLGSAALGSGLVLRGSAVIAPAVEGFLHHQAAARAACIVALLILSWLALLGTRRLLYKLIDWNRLGDMDQYVGGMFGLCRGVALVWVTVSLVLTVAPASVRYIEQSRASVRVLAIGERLSGLNQRPESAPAIEQTASLR